MLNIHINTISLVILVICLFSAITLYPAIRTRNISLFNRVLMWAVLYMFLHTLIVFILEVWYPAETWKSRLAPFGLFYGPLLYYGITSVKYRKLRWWEILLNAMPFIVYFSVFLLLVTGIIPPNDANKSLFEQHLTILNPASFTSYAVWSVTSGRSLRDNKLKGKVLLFVFARILLLFVTILSFGVAFSGDLTDEAILLFRITMYICLFLSVLIIFNYKINKLIYSAGKQQHVTDDNSIKLPPLPKYERSSLSEKQLAAYQDRLLKAMQTQRIFLNKELSLTSLASILKIPNHHLTQVFSMQLQQTFYQYINNLRIEHACVLLADSNVPNLEELAEISGFNSKVSFNRHFKAIMNCTPSEFKKKHESRSR